MALQANTIDLRDRVRERVGADAFDSYLAKLEVVEASADRVVLRVGPTLAREAFRRCGPALATACRQLYRSRRVLLAGDDETFELGEGQPRHCERGARRSPAATASRLGTPGRVRQRSGPCGQPGARERLDAQKTLRVPFALAASLPRTASQAFRRHDAEDPLEYVGRWGKAYSEETLTPFHHRLPLGALRLAQTGCLTDQGVACSVNLLLLAGEGKGSRELPVARDQVLPALTGLIAANATYTAHHVAEHSGEPYIAEQRKLERPVIEEVLVRTADDPERLVSLTEIMVRGDNGRFAQAVALARGGGASILIRFADWVLDALQAPVDQAGRTFVLLDVEAFLAVGSRRLFTWLAIVTAPVVDAKAPLPERASRPPNNTVYKRIDLNHVNVRDFGRHGQDLDRVCEDIREDLCGEHGIAAIDKRIHAPIRCGPAACSSCGCAGAPQRSCPTVAGYPDAWPPGDGGLSAATCSPTSACTAAGTPRARVWQHARTPRAATAACRTSSGWPGPKRCPAMTATARHLSPPAHAASPIRVSPALRPDHRRCVGALGWANDCRQRRRPRLSISP